MTEKFSTLTKFVCLLERESDGSWNNKGKYRDADGKTGPYNTYEDVVRDLLHAIYDFCEAHPEYRTNEYSTVLKENGLEWNYRTLVNADISNAEPGLVLNLLMYAVRSDHFCEGSFQRFCESGAVQRWLRRLMETEMFGEAK